MDRQLAPGLEIHQAEPALRVWQWLVSDFGDALAHPAIYEPPHERHLGWLAHAIADDQVGVLFLGTSKKTRNVVGGVLAISIERQGPAEAALEGAVPASLQGSPFAGTAIVSENFSSGVLRNDRGFVR